MSGCVCGYLHGVFGVFVVEDEGLLDELVIALQLVDLWLVVDDALLVLPQVGQLVLQRAVHLDGDAADFLHTRTHTEPRPSVSMDKVRMVGEEKWEGAGCHGDTDTHLHLVLDPWPDDVGLLGELPAQALVVLLPRVFLHQRLVSQRHQLLHLHRVHTHIHSVILFQPTAIKTFLV